MDLPTPTLNHILNQMVLLAEREPYGVRGGTLVVLFGPPHTTPTSPSLVKIGKFPLDPTMVSTYELHLTLQSTDKVIIRDGDLKFNFFTCRLS